MRRRFFAVLPLALPLLALATPAERTVHRCVRDGSVSLATAPEPGARCTARTLGPTENIATELARHGGSRSGALYRVGEGANRLLTTRELPGAERVLAFAIPVPPHEPAHEGLGRTPDPRPEAHSPLFRAASTRYGVDEAWLRAVAQVESDFRADAVSPKGAMGVMQLMPATAREYGVRNPYSPAESIAAGARLLARLLARYEGDRRLALAAYNAGPGAVARYGGVPPYAETRRYVAKVEALSQRYAQALAP